ncbi:MAG: radical SAM protein [Candidatus Promineifilaceae bacterium]
MRLNSLHLMLTYQCTLACDHCFAWGSTWQTGTMTQAVIDRVLDEAEALGGVSTIYFEGGEPFLFYPLLLHGAREAFRRGFGVGLVTNCYWATSFDDALAWLDPFRGLLDDFSVSYDSYHWPEQYGPLVQNARDAAYELGLPAGTISIAAPETSAATSLGQLAAGESAVMYRGRAAQSLAPDAKPTPWRELDICPFEDLVDPGRVHIDPLGYVHICQGITIGNLFAEPLAEIVEAYDPMTHPICAPLLAGGPAELVRRYKLPLEGAYGDACHLCDTARRALRTQFPHILAPEQMYGVVGEAVEVVFEKD